MPGKSKLTADAAEQAVLRDLSKSEHRGEADRARAILLTLEGRRAGEIAAVLGVHISRPRPSSWCKFEWHLRWPLVRPPGVEVLPDRRRSAAV